MTAPRLVATGLLAFALAAGTAAEPLPAAEQASPAQPTLGDRVAASERTRKIKRLSERTNAGVGNALGAAGNAFDRAGKSVGGLFGRLDAKVTETLGGIGLEPDRRGAEAASRPGWGNRDR